MDSLTLHKVLLGGLAPFEVWPEFCGDPFLQGWQWSPHFTAEEAEAHRREVVYVRLV